MKTNFFCEFHKNEITRDIFSSVQFSHSLVVWLFATPWTAAYQTSLSTTNSRSLLKLMFIELWCHPTISTSVIPFSYDFYISQHQGLFQWIGSSHQVAKVLEFQLQHQSFQWTPRTDLLYFSLATSLAIVDLPAPAGPSIATLNPILNPSGKFKICIRNTPKSS